MPVTATLAADTPATIIPTDENIQAYSEEGGELTEYWVAFLHDQPEAGTNFDLIHTRVF